MVAEVIAVAKVFQRSIFVVFTILTLGLLYLGIDLRAFQGVEIDVCADIYRVVDGDTFDVFPVGRVRLADIDAPELDTPEGEIARQALLSLVNTYGSRVYLDVDDLYVIDRYNRVVAVVYLRYNSTHAVNVNKWLIDNGYASVSDHRNEFNPYTWEIYVYLPYDPCIGITVKTAPLITTTTSLAIMTTVEETTTITKTYTSVVVTTTIIIEGGQVSAVLVSIVSVVLFAVGYFLGRRIG